MRSRGWLLPALGAAFAWGHAVSMSSGDLTVTGARAHYTLRMPLYEISHTAHPEDALLAHIRFAGARMTTHSCRTDAAQDTFLCEADYQFDAPPSRVDVECTLFAATVPNHVHLLRATLGGRQDQAIFDFSFPRATLRFRPPTALETAVTQAGGGALRALGGAAQILFLASLVLAARSRRELIALTTSFLVAESLACVLAPRIPWPLSPRFIEAAAALTIAYLAFEIVLLPESRYRWLVVGVLGLFHGAYFSMFLAQSGYRAPAFLSGVALAELLLIALFSLALAALARFAATRRAVPVAASLLLVTGVVWFFIRLRV